ncbi:MAG TPA: hypothetical protein VGS20_08245 [Candidatus Acidoferrales bacterium]|nr:hypothetical protein [Candidatus Acidoferrales bacterium]
MRATGYRRARLAALLAFGIAALAAACSEAPAGSSGAGAPKTPPAVPAGYQAAAEGVLGRDAEVILSGDLARNGHIQLLVAARLLTTPKGVVPGLLVSRAAILEKDDDHWREIFLADEYLKNPKGFLGGTPPSSVTAWRVQYEQGAAGLEMYLTPLEQPAEGSLSPIGVRWNPATRRYQSLDHEFKKFLPEAPSLQGPPEFRMNQ